MNHARRLAAVLLAALALLLGAAGTASAHAALLSTEPAAGAVLRTAPTEVTLRFSESVTLPPDALRVFDPGGHRVDTGAAGHAPGGAATAEVRLLPGLAAGTYTVAWRAVSADSHPVSGAFTFSYGHTSAVTAVPGEGVAHGSRLVGALYGATRAVQYLAFALLAGTAALVLGCWPGGSALRGVQRLLLTGWASLLLATIAQLLLRGPYAQAAGLGRVLDLSLVQQSLGERLGTLLAVRVLLLAAAGVLLALLAPGAPGGRLRTGLGAAGGLLAVALALTWALGGHAAVGMQAWLAVPLDALHLLAMAAWLGGLAAVIAGLRAAPEQGGIGPAEVGRYSALALGAVTVLAATGAYAAWRGAGSWDALLTTAYGRLLLLKLALVAVIVAAAWLSRRWTALLRGEPAATVTGPKTGSATVGADDRAARAVAAGDGDGSAAGAERRDAAAGAARAGACGAAPPGAAGSPGDRPADAATAADADAPTTATARAGAPEPSGAAAPHDAPVAGAGGAVTADAEADPVRRAQLARQAAARAAAAQRRAREAAPARGMLLRSTLLEACFALAVLVVTTLLTNAPPARSVAAARAATRPVDVTLAYDTGGTTAAAKGSVRIVIAPARVGSDTVDAYLTGAGGRPVDVPELDVALTLPARGLGPLRARVVRVGPGHWSAAGVALPMAGRWTLSVSVRSDDIDEITRTAQVRIGG